MKDTEKMSEPEMRGEIRHLRTLLAVAKCPNCDGSGGKPVRASSGDWEQEQCQWCHEQWDLLGTLHNGQ